MRCCRSVGPSHRTFASIVILAELFTALLGTVIRPATPSKSAAVSPPWKPGWPSVIPPAEYWRPDGSPFRHERRPARAFLPVASTRSADPPSLHWHIGLALRW